ncbi:MAG TPA: peptidase domain-containing ABC transporter, partial [Planctomycetota bacterium]|nr:peptidase domain-containing ABC transporter [Planctomycetota bacterium]
GEFFGELALLTGSARAATVVAVTDSQLYSMGKAGFDRALTSSPAFRARLEERAALYRSQAAAGTEAPRDLVDPDADASEASIPAATAVQAPLWRRLLRKYPYVRQHDETDCGAACMAMITEYYGSPVGVARMRDLANVDADGATMWSVAQAAETLGFHARGLQLSYEALSDVQLPAIVHWEGYHYIVLWEVSKRGVLVGDPGIALRRLSADEFKRGWTGRALELVPTAKFGTTEKIKSPFRRFWPMIRPHSGLLAEVLGASLLLSILGLGIPLFTQTILDRVLVTSGADLLNVLLAGMLGIAVFQALLMAVRRALLVHVSTAANARLVSDFLRHVLSLPMKFFDLRRVGDVISRVGENDKIRAALVGTIPGVILDTVLALGYFGLMAFYNTSLMLVVLAVVPLFVILMLAFTPAIRRNRQEHFTKHADAWSTMIESFTGIGTVKATATEPAVRWKMETQFVESVLVARKGARIETVSSTLAAFLQTSSAILFLWYGARQVMAGAMTVGQLLAFTTLAASVIAPILRLVDAWDELQDVGNALDRLNDVFDAKPEEDGRTLLTLPSLQGRITFDHVMFKYSSGQDKPTLAGVTIELNPGETVAVVGRSGSGKSTLAKLILGLYPPTKGRLLIDGHDLRTLNRRALRRRIGVVPQEVFLFSGTIRENIALGDPDVGFDRIVEAARLAGAHDFITGMAMGYDTKVGERGMSMSGGQRQRIALARALLRKPDILVLDEATSALDNESERAIQQNLQEAARGRTTIVIAHRLSTVRNADRILVLDAGSVVEQGRHDELVGKAGLYASLVGQQVQE